MDAAFRKPRFAERMTGTVMMITTKKETQMMLRQMMRLVDEPADSGGGFRLDGGRSEWEGCDNWTGLWRERTSKTRRVCSNDGACKLQDGDNGYVVDSYYCHID